MGKNYFLNLLTTQDCPEFAQEQAFYCGEWMFRGLQAAGDDARCTTFYAHRSKSCSRQEHSPLMLSNPFDRHL